MNNRDIAAAWEYHDGTKHSYASIRRNTHRLDWNNQPIPFKIYRDLEPIPLPRDFSLSGVPGLQAVAAGPFSADGECVPDLPSLASLLYHSAGITRRREYWGGQIEFRAAAC